MLFGKKDEEMIACDKCGMLFPKSKLKKCKTCGSVLCSKCRKHHVCDTTTELSGSQNYNSISQNTNNYTPLFNIDKENGQLSFLNRDCQNPQCIRKMTDMRIYDIARNPSIMTSEEEIIIFSDEHILHRYRKYREEIERKGY